MKRKKNFTSRTGDAEGAKISENAINHRHLEIHGKRILRLLGETRPGNLLFL